MSRFERELVRDLLAEVDRVQLRELEPPAHVVERRMKLANMVLHEVPADDLAGLAVRGLASALLELSIAPGDRASVDGFLAARRGYLDALGAAGDAG